MLSNSTSVHKLLYSQIHSRYGASEQTSNQDAVDSVGSMPHLEVNGTDKLGLNSPYKAIHT